jgi:Fur family peroxide stress response transcriptional regulator
MQPATHFRELCHRHHLAATHQRQLIYETVMAMPGHPSPETIYDKVRKKIPSISLATVYKNVHTFLDSGVLREVSLHHGPLRVEANEEAHHHVLCVNCKSIMDLETNSMEAVLLQEKLPRGFQVRRIAVDVIGVCLACSDSGRLRQTNVPKIRKNKSRRTVHS